MDIKRKRTTLSHIVNDTFNMHEFIKRNSEPFVFQNMEVFPAVVILGPRKCGKSTLVKMLSGSFPSFLYLDLQNMDDFKKLSEPMLFFDANKEATICLDEIQLAPGLFSTLRVVIDKDRRNGRFILLGSASRDLIRQTSESLAGRVGFIELSPFTIKELHHLEEYSLHSFWLRGGFPDSYLSRTDDNSKLWRENFIRTYIERDIPQLGFQIPALQLRRFLMMCGHNHGQLLNASKLGESMGLTHPTIRRYIDLLEQTFIVRSVPPYLTNIKKRLIKSPKIFIRDSGILHRLLSIGTFNDLLGNPIFGFSWEGFVIENILSNMREWAYYFYRTSSGDEIDLVLQRGNERIAVECKASSAPQLSKGFWNAIEDIKPDHTYVIIPTDDSYPVKEDVDVCGLEDFFLLRSNIRS